MADPLDAYNKEIQRRSGPFGLNPAQTRGGTALQLPLRAVEGLGGVADFLLSAPEKMGAATLDYLTGPSQFVRDVQSGKIPESEIPLGVDLVDIFGDTDPTLGAPDFVPDDLEAGEIFKFDPTGEGKTKGMPETKAEREAREAREISEQFGDIEFDITNKIDAQLAENAEKKRAQRAEDFRQQEAKIAGMTGQGTYNQSIDTIADSEQMFASAMQDFIEGVRGAGPDTKEMSIEDYKKEFSDATGIDISGKPDKSQALMAFGLALMQNKAGGKGITGMLGAIGEAGQAAMPALEKAKSEARAAALAGGKFALQTRATDRATDAANQEKMMNRSGYWVFERGGKDGEYANFDNGKLVQLNKYELNKLINDPNFDENFSFISGSQYMDVQKERAKAPDYGDQWAKSKTISLIGDADGPKIFNVEGAYRNPNYKGPRGANSIQLAEDPNDVYRRILLEQEKVDRMADQFQTAVQQINEGISIPEQIGSSVVMGLRNLGFNVGSGTTSIKQVKNFLQRTQAENAANILGEMGKTLSDNDRKMVAEIVGTIDFKVATEEELLQKLAQVYDRVVQQSQRNINMALETLENGAGVTIPRSNEMSEEDLAFLNERRATQGKPPLTMEDVAKFK